MGESGLLSRTFLCAGPEAIVSLSYFQSDKFVFAQSAHTRVSVWDTQSYSLLQKYPADLITCGAHLSSMRAIRIEQPELFLLMLAGVDGSLCIRRVNKRTDGKINCVLLCYLEDCSSSP